MQRRSVTRAQNMLLRLREFELGIGCTRAGLDLANIVVQRCPDLERLSRLKNWGRVSREQVEYIFKEVWGAKRSKIKNKNCLLYARCKKFEHINAS
jgi:hypothetical protein